MASEQEVLSIVIDPMAALFGRPFGCTTAEDAETAQAQYVEALTAFPAEALRNAWAEIRRMWTKTTWPPIGTITEVASRFRREAATVASGHPDRSRRFAAAIEYMEVGTAPPPGLNLPLKQLIAARVAALVKHDLPPGKRAPIPLAEAEAMAQRILREAM